MKLVRTQVANSTGQGNLATARPKPLIGGITLRFLVQPAKKPPRVAHSDQRVARYETSKTFCDLLRYRLLRSSLLVEHRPTMAEVGIGPFLPA